MYALEKTIGRAVITHGHLQRFFIDPNHSAHIHDASSVLKCLVLSLFFPFPRYRVFPVGFSHGIGTSSIASRTKSSGSLPSHFPTCFLLLHWFEFCCHAGSIPLIVSETNGATMETIHYSHAYHTFFSRHATPDTTKVFHSFVAGVFQNICNEEILLTKNPWNRPRVCKRHFIINSFRSKGRKESLPCSHRFSVADS